YTVPHLETSLMMFVQLKVHDNLGNEVATLVYDYQLAGNYEVEFNGSNFSSGIYFYAITGNNYIETKKMILLK
ncbi:MAG: T9SS type A sorting domain-containing protein, partial [Ignavibacterium sp.]